MNEQLQNCYKLLDYIDNGFQKRLAEGVVDYRAYGVPRLKNGNHCGSWGCLLGWYLMDVGGVVNCVELLESAKNIHVSTNDIFGLGEKSNRVFGINAGDIQARRAALVEHIKHLESQEYDGDQPASKSFEEIIKDLQGVSA